jgi:uncharacterized membrane protein
MDAFLALYSRHPMVFFHLLAALAALVVGVIQLRRSSMGDAGHRLWGWTWVALMGTVVVTSIFIRDYRMPNIAGFTPIHLFTLFVAWQLPLAVYYAKQGRIVAHRKAMRGLFFGGCIAAGVFTLLPGRFLGHLLWHNTLGLI